MESESYSSNNNNSGMCDVSSVDNEDALNGQQQNTEDLIFESRSDETGVRL